MEGFPSPLRLSGRLPILSVSGERACSPEAETKKQHDGKIGLLSLAK
jgi:hypothetical protein